MLRIEEELKNNNFSRFHLIHGEERYMVKYYKNGLLKKMTVPDDEMNCTIFQGDDINVSAIADAGQLMPFFAEKRVLVIVDSGFCKSASEISDYMESFPPSTYVIFVEKEVDKRNKLYKWISKNGCVTNCEFLPEPRLKQWIAAYLKKAGKAMSVKSIEYLLERVGSSMEMLSNELDKLIGYVGEREVVERDDIDTISSGLVVSKVFDMIDAVAFGNRDKALSLYADLLSNKEAPMSILYLFTRHINILLQYKELSGLGLNSFEMAKKIGVPEFTLKKYSSQASLFKRSKLLVMLNSRTEKEMDFKSGRISDQVAVELFLLEALTNG